MTWLLQNLAFISYHFLLQVVAQPYETSFNSFTARHSLASESFPLHGNFFISPLHLFRLLHNHHCLWKAPIPPHCPAPMKCFSSSRGTRSTWPCSHTLHSQAMSLGVAQSQQKHVLKKWVAEWIGKLMDGWNMPVLHKWSIRSLLWIET